MLFRFWAAVTAAALALFLPTDALAQGMAGLTAPTPETSCAGAAATIVVTASSPRVVHGTSHADVILAQDPGHIVRAAGGDDVGARREEDARLVHIQRPWHVQHAVRVQLDDRVDVVRRLHAGGRSVGEVAGIAPDLVVAVHPQADQVHLRVVDDPLERPGTDVAGRPLDDPEPAHADYPAGSASVFRSRNSSIPAAPISRPMPDCL